MAHHRPAQVGCPQIVPGGGAGDDRDRSTVPPTTHPGAHETATGSATNGMAAAARDELIDAAGCQQPSVVYPSHSHGRRAWVTPSASRVPWSAYVAYSPIVVKDRGVLGPCGHAGRRSLRGTRDDRGRCDAWAEGWDSCNRFVASVLIPIGVSC
jgi:hypothetical protein